MARPMRSPTAAEARSIQATHERMKDALPEACEWGDPDEDGFLRCKTAKRLHDAVVQATRLRSGEARTLAYRRATKAWGEHSCTLPPMPRGEGPSGGGASTDPIVDGAAVPTSPPGEPQPISPRFSPDSETSEAEGMPVEADSQGPSGADALPVSAGRSTSPDSTCYAVRQAHAKAVAAALNSDTRAWMAAEASFDAALNALHERITPETRED